MSLIESITATFQYLDGAGIPIPHDILLTARLKGIPVKKAGGDLASVSESYQDAITQSLIDFFEGASLSTARNSFKRAVVESFGNAFDLGWTDGGEELPFTGEPLEWFNARIEQEFGHISMLFQEAKEIKKEEGEFLTWVVGRANGYKSTLSAIYNAAKMWAKSNMIGVWELGSTEKHCATCLKLDGQSHKLSWYISHNYIPRQPGASLDCGGYNCDCKIRDKKTGNEITI